MGNQKFQNPTCEEPILDNTSEILFCWLYLKGSIPDKFIKLISFAVLKSFDLLRKCHQLLVVGDWIITIGDPRRLNCYDINDGSELRCQWLSKYPSGMTDVVLDGKTCIALSYW